MAFRTQLWMEKQEFWWTARQWSSSPMLLSGYFETRNCQNDLGPRRVFGQRPWVGKQPPNIFENFLHGSATKSCSVIRVFNRLRGDSALKLNSIEVHLNKYISPVPYTS